MVSVFLFSCWSLNYNGWQLKGGDTVMKTNLLDEMLDALTEEHAVDPQKVRKEALRLYLNVHPGLKLDGVVVLWRRSRISLAKAAEIAGLTVPELKDVLAARGVIRETEGKSGAEMDAKLREILP
jgi:predicted HTH domain antitoxin